MDIGKGGPMLDIHSHILPGVDDGARSHRQALQMLAAARDAGIDILVATPHLRHLKDDVDRISEAFFWLKPYAQASGIHLLRGYEVSYQVLLDLPCSELGNYCISGTNLLLLELDKLHLFPQWNRVLGSLAKAGYELVIAHPERYVYIQEHPEIIGKIRRYGCKIQIDAHAYLNPPWNIERRTAEKIMRKGWIDYIASDAHHPQDYMQMKKVLKKLQGRLPGEIISQGSTFILSSSL
jgi:protein-tyrosine phosphatase